MKSGKTLNKFVFMVSMAAFILMPAIQAQASVPETASLSTDQKNPTQHPESILLSKDDEEDKEKMESPDDHDKGTGNDGKADEPKKEKKKAKKKKGKKKSKKHDDD